MTTQNHAHNIYVVGLRNAHAMEKQALSIMEPQVSRLTHYPNLSQRLQSHISETEEQINRLDLILERLDESSSVIKDMMTSASGSMAAMGHAAASDEVLKNTMANLAFENFEIAAYLSLLTAAKLAGDTASIQPLEQSLEEERRMAAWVEEQVPTVTETFITLTAAGETAKR
ncbi:MULTISPECIES: ferritin-like domain-containing protein [unclassified Yoonia]|uniref:ferritin-like domain-containing protein n=1 Tax=unclassified Yoonia TaxID=2629118 RepID=UPI002AFF822D|nr:MULTISPECIES: ferritin-like domain-containing protein [unclassified Yoonia]